MLSINISELVLTIISFFLLLFLLNKFLYQPVLKFMKERQVRIDAGLEKERGALAEIAESEKRIDEAKAAKREEAKAILAGQRAEDGKAHDEYARQLMADNAKERREARARVDAMAQDAKAKLDSEKEQLAQTLAERLTGK